MVNVMDIVKKQYLSHKDKFKDVQPGCDVRVLYKIREQDKERTLQFSGLVIARKGGGLSETITIRSIVDGIGVERIFLLNAPNIVDIEVLKKGKVRRAKLYYIRRRVGRATKLEEKLEKAEQKEEQIPTVESEKLQQSVEAKVNSSKGESKSQ